MGVTPSAQNFHYLFIVWKQYLKGNKISPRSNSFHSKDESLIKVYKQEEK